MSRRAPRELHSSEESLVPRAILVVRAVIASTLVRSVHQLESPFDTPPRLGIFVHPLHFEARGLLSGFRNGLGAVCR